MDIKSLHQVPLLNALPPLLSYGAPEAGLLGLEPIGRGDDATTVTQLEGEGSRLLLNHLLHWRRAWPQISKLHRFAEFDDPYSH